jgi:uncharacterized protein (TIGR02611 family)
VWRVGIAALGGVVIVAGIVMLVVPGPGWVVIFIGLGIWATEFAWAQSLLVYVRRQATVWTAWARRQPRWLWVGAGTACLAAVAAVAWLVLS